MTHMAVTRNSRLSVLSLGGHDEKVRAALGELETQDAGHRERLPTSHQCALNKRKPRSCSQP